MFEEYRLKNNARVVLVPQKDTVSLTLMVMLPVGSRYESEKMRGVSHFLEHMLFKGTKKRKTSFILTREIDRLGAEYNAFTGKEYTAYYIKTDSTFAGTACDILSDMLFNSLFDAKEMEREKKVVVEEIRMYRDNPIMNIDTIFEELMFAGPLGRDIAGTPEHVLSYKRDDVLKYVATHYDASNMTIVAAGKIPDGFREMLAACFEVKTPHKKGIQRYEPAAYGPVTKSQRVKVDKKQTDQAQMMIGFPGFAVADPRIPTVSVLNTILGGSMSSRLFVRIREKLGLAYTVRSGNDAFRDIGYVSVHAGLDPKNINKAIAAIMNEMKKMSDKGITKRELDDAKTHLHGSFALSLEDSSTQANWYARQALFSDHIETPEQRLRAIEHVTKDDVQQLAAHIFRPKQMRVGVIGDIDAAKITLP